MTRRILVVVLLAALGAGCKDKAKPEEPVEEGKTAETEAPAQEEKAAEPGPEEEAAPGPPLDGKNVVMIIACKDFRDEELAEPRKALEAAGARVVVASTSRQGCKGMLGAEVTPDLVVGDIVVDEFDAVVFVGGSGSAALYDDEKILSVAREAEKDGLVVGAICLAPGILAKAGVLEGKKATAYDSELARKAFEEGGATYTGAKVVVDGVYVTANGPAAAGAFGEKLVELLE
jgi:protease I